MKISINFGWLVVIFVILKLCNVITWSWFWVVSPLWIPVAVILAFLGTVLAFALIVLLVALIAFVLEK